MKKLIPVMAAVVCLSGLSACARGGGIGLEAMLADHNCEAAGYRLGTREYAACRQAAAIQSAANADAMMAYYARQQELLMQQTNRRQTCMYKAAQSAASPAARSTACDPSILPQFQAFCGTAVNRRSGHSSNGLVI
jgi:hypothetical protein